MSRDSSCSKCEQDENWSSTNHFTKSHLNHKEDFCFQSQDLRNKICELEKVAADLNGKFKILKNYRSEAQKKNNDLIQQYNQLMEEIRQKTIFTENAMRREEEIALEAEKWSQIWLSENGKKILADKRLLENAHQVKVIQQQIEYTHRVLEHKRKVISRWQSTGLQKVHKEDLLQLEVENMNTERKIVDWVKENRRLLKIFEAMKNQEIELVFAIERCLHRNRQAREECNEMQSQILALSRMLDERSVQNNTNTTSSISTTAITLNNDQSASTILRRPAGASQSRNSIYSSSIRRFAQQHTNIEKQQRMDSDKTEGEWMDDSDSQKFLELMRKRCNLGLRNCFDNTGHERSNFLWCDR